MATEVRRARRGTRPAGHRPGARAAGAVRSSPKPDSAPDTSGSADVAVRVAAVRVVAGLLAGDGSLTRLLPAAQAALPATERALLQAYAYGLARWSAQLAAVLERLLERPLKRKHADLQLLLQLGLFQLLHTRTPPHAAVDRTVEATAALGTPWARGLVNAVLRNALRRGETLLDGLDEGARLAHPPWLLEALRADWPERWRAIVEANNRQAAMALRVNLAAVSRESYHERLAADGIAAAPIDAVPAGLVLERPVAVEALPGFADGHVSVQDGAAQLAVGFLAKALAPGSRLLDACAAPGGKSAQALESGRFGELVALDRDAERLRRVAETFERLGLGGAGVTLRAVDAADTDAWWDGRAFDAVLIDAPCTGTGVIRRHPDIKLLRRASDVPALVAEQRRLLDALWPTLAPGGALLYATCSVLRAEGEGQIRDFLARRPEARLACERRVFPGGEGDGFYHALVSRAA